MTNESNVCACAICGGTECQCGCQAPAAVAASRQCVDDCTCGDTCTCPACNEATAAPAEGR